MIGIVFSISAYVHSGRVLVRPVSGRLGGAPPQVKEEGLIPNRSFAERAIISSPYFYMKWIHENCRIAFSPLMLTCDSPPRKASNFGPHLRGLCTCRRESHKHWFNGSAWRGLGQSLAPTRQWPLVLGRLGFKVSSSGVVSFPPPDARL